MEKYHFMCEIISSEAYHMSRIRCEEPGINLRSLPSHRSAVTVAAIRYASDSGGALCERLPVVPLPEHRAHIYREKKILLRIQGHDGDADRAVIKRGACFQR